MATFIVDACLKADFGIYLMKLGYDVIYIPYLDISMPDDEIMELGYELDAYILSADKDFRDYEKFLKVKNDMEIRELYKRVGELDV